MKVVPAMRSGRNSVIADYMRKNPGVSLRSAGRVFAVSQEHIRNVCHEYDVVYGYEAQAIARFGSDAERWTEAETEPCVVCLRPNYRAHELLTRKTPPKRPYVTCSKLCADIFAHTDIRRYIIPGYRDYHNDQLARSALAHPEHYSPSHLRHAHRRLAGETRLHRTPSINEKSPVLQILRLLGRDDIIAGLRILPDTEEMAYQRRQMRKYNARATLKPEGKGRKWLE